jgi:hypothetical protein
LICFILTAIISILRASGVRYNKVWKVTLLSCFLAEYIVIFIVYLVTFLLGEFYKIVYSLMLWNIGLCCVAWAGALISLVLYLKEQINFITSLWVSSKIKLNHKELSDKMYR